VEQMHDPNEFLCVVLGLYYSPQVEGLSVAEWLRHVRTILE
jgi:hypothetical protein